VDTLPPPAQTVPRAALQRPSTELAQSQDRSGSSLAPIASDAATAIASRLAATTNSVIAGKPEVVEIAVATLLAGGHLLIEDIPGVGKTLLAQVISRSLGGSFRRIQGTSDLLPGDITGSMIPGAARTTMTFRPGPVFANIVVFDELNRTTPRTQSALLELTEEATVSVDGVSHQLPDPFMLNATQNPTDIAGTYGLGEGSLDRFAAVITPGRATRQSELEVLTGRQGRSMLEGVGPVASLDEIRQIRHYVGTVDIADVLVGYVVDLLAATRTHPAIRLGASTRGGVSLIALARARAVMRGRTYVIADDVSSLAVAALAHRVVLVERSGSIAAGRALVAACLAAGTPPTA
jgi:MoxR-like ATPase